MNKITKSVFSHYKNTFNKITSSLMICISTTAFAQSFCQGLFNKNKVCIITNPSANQKSIINNDFVHKLPHENWKSDKNNKILDKSLNTNEETNKTINIYNNNNAIDINISKNIKIDDSDQDYAIQATNIEPATDIRIKTQNINSSSGGISARNEGLGSTAVSSGTINTRFEGVKIFAGEKAQNIDIHTEDIESQEASGIFVNNEGKGATNISANNVTAHSAATGISVLHENNTKKVSIQAKDVTGDEGGIGVINNGTESTIINADNVHASQGIAILIQNGEQTSDANIKVKNVHGMTGINIYNYGRGSTNVTTNNITAPNEAIHVENGEQAHNLQIKADDIYGDTGIFVQNYGTGTTLINTGNIIAAGEAVHIENGENARDLSITTGNIEAGSGIITNNNGNGRTSIITGNINARDDNAIQAYNDIKTNDLYIQARNITGASAIIAENSGTGSTTIITQGNITATQEEKDAVYVSNSDTAYDININHKGGTISGTNNAINTANYGTGSTNMIIAGKVNGGIGAGIITHGNIGATNTITLDNGAHITAYSGIAIKDDEANTHIILNNGAKVSGQILLGDGNDTFTINHGDTSTITVLDAGNKDTNGLNGNGVKDIDTLNINGWLTGSSSSEGKENDTALRNWSIINIGGKSQSQTDSTLNLTGDLTTNQLNINRSGKLTFNGFSAEASSDHSLSEPHFIIINGNVTNAGIISLGNKHTGDNLTITGDYNGAKGTLILDTELNDDKSITDKLAISGNASGTTSIQINNIKGLGADTGNSKGIEIISVAGTNITDAENEPVFTLTGSHVDAGAYEYRLFSGDQTREDSNWYLRSRIKDTPKQDDKTTIVSNHPDNKPVITKPTYRKETPLNSSTAAQLLQADSLMLANLHRRTGTTPTAEQRRSWGRVITSRTNIRQNGTTSPHTSGHYNGLQMGSDIWNNPHWHTGGYLGYLNGHLNVAGFASGINGNVGKNDIQSYFLGAYSTYTSNTGSYLDIVLQGAQHQADIRPTGNQASKQKGHGITASVEIGKPFTIGHSAWKLEPQTQIMRQWLHLNDSQISGNTTVSQNGDNVWLFRIGGRMHGDFQFNKGIFHPYARINFIYSPDGDDYTTYTTRTTSTTLNTSLAHSSTEIAIGGSYEISNKMRLYGEFGHTKSNGGDAQIKAPFNGSLGFKAEW